MHAAAESLQLRIHGDTSLPALVYLPGLHGDWTLVSSFRAAVTGRVRFAEVTYPRTVTWSLDDYAAALESALSEQGIRSGWLLAESFGSLPAWQLIARQRPPGACETVTSAAHGSHTGPNATSELRTPTSRTGSANLGPTRGDVPIPAGSPIAWGSRFQSEGLILAGGFARHPFMPEVWLARRLNAALPCWTLRLLLRIYAAHARIRHRHEPETLEHTADFVANRLAPGDAEAITHRLHLIAANDLQPVAASTHLPVYHLAGLLDPIVPFPPVRSWLRRQCPGYRGSRLISGADHHVLGTAPLASAQQVLQWMGLGR